MSYWDTWKQSNICPVCKEEYTFNYRMRSEDGVRSCEHDVMMGARVIDSRVAQNQRKGHEKDLLQPFSNGKVNPHFRQVYGDGVYKKQFKMNKKQIDKAV